MIAHARGPGGTSVLLFLIVHRTWLDCVRLLGLLDHVVARTISILADRCRRRIRETLDALTRTKSERGGGSGREKKHDDGPGIEPVSNLH